MTSEKLRVLVTAVGGDFGQALVKALRLSASPIEIIACDGNATGIGAAFGDSYHVVPLAKDTANYLDQINDLCASLHLDAVIPASEPEIATLSRLGLARRLRCGASVICQEHDWIETYGDKLNCMRALVGQIELAPFADGLDRTETEGLVAQSGFPLVVKARRSSGSRTVRIAHDQNELNRFLKETTAPVVQAYLEATGGEFTVGLFRGREFMSVIAFRRELGPRGCSWFAETSEDPEVLAYADRVAQVTSLTGSANLQVRKTRAGVRMLEINPRFSSLVAARAVCGFRDAEWSLREALGLPITPPSSPYRRIRFQRYFHEVVDFGNGFQAVQHWLPKQVTK